MNSPKPALRLCADIILEHLPDVVRSYTVPFDPLVFVLDFWSSCDNIQANEGFWEDMIHRRISHHVQQQTLRIHYLYLLLLQPWSEPIQVYVWSVTSKENFVSDFQIELSKNGRTTGSMTQSDVYFDENQLNLHG